MERIYLRNNLENMRALSTSPVTVGEDCMNRIPNGRALAKTYGPSSSEGGTLGVGSHGVWTNRR
jgi:hypothetical protein